PETLHINLFMWRVQTPLPYPPRAKTCFFFIFSQLIVVGGPCRRTRKCFFYFVPIFFPENFVSPIPPVIVVSNYIKHRCIGAGPGKVVACKPGDERRTLRDLVRDLAVFSLKFFQEFQRCSCGCKITVRVYGQRTPEGIPPKKPGKSRPF